MKDLYRQLGFDGQMDGLGMIRAAILSQPDRSVAQNAEEILMRPSRKAVYDRQRGLMQVIGRLRAELGLSDTLEWQEHGADFTYKPRHVGAVTNRVLAGYRTLRGHPVIALVPLTGIVIVFAVLSVVGTFSEKKKPGFKTESATELANSDAPPAPRPYGIKLGDPATPTVPPLVPEGMDVWRPPVVVHAAPRPQEVKPVARPLPAVIQQTLDNPAPAPSVLFQKKGPQEPTVSAKQAVPVPAQVAPVTPPCPLPRNGETIFAGTKELVAPLGIKTRAGEGHFFVKLVERGTGKTAFSFFVGEGQTADVKVPLGSYELRYATGSSWYGQKMLFGDKTRCARALEPFDFEIDGDYVTGYDVELYLQVEGNLETKAMSREDF